MDNNYQNTPKQQKVSVREQKKNRVMMAIAITFTLLLVLFTVLLCINVVMELRGPSKSPDEELPNDPADPSENEQPSDGDTTVYQTISLSSRAIGEGSLILVNASHVYQFPATNDHLVDVYTEQENAKTRGVYFQLAKKLSMDKTAYQAMNKMLTEFARQSGRSTVLLADAYRSYEQQAALNSATKAGYSDSHTGLSCALQVSEGGHTGYLSDAAVYDWIYQNCHKYGFTVRYPAGKENVTGVSDYDYYFRYVGYPHAYAMKTRGLCLEEYVELLRNYSKESPLKLTTDDGSTYEIYYVTATGEETAVTVPADGSYTVSGDNKDGFIVTVKLS